MELKLASNVSSVATLNPYSGLVMAHKAGTATIYATATDGSGVCGCCEVWVKGKTPVFVLHGRTSNSFDTWGAANGIFVNPLNPEEKDNNHFDSNINALSQGNVRALYTSKTVQEIRSYSFFSYDSREALHLSDDEKTIILDCLSKIIACIKEMFNL